MTIDSLQYFQLWKLQILTSLVLTPLSPCGPILWPYPVALTCGPNLFEFSRQHVVSARWWFLLHSSPLHPLFPLVLHLTRTVQKCILVTVENVFVRWSQEWKYSWENYHFTNMEPLYMALEAACYLLITAWNMSYQKVPTSLVTYKESTILTGLAVFDTVWRHYKILKFGTTIDSWFMSKLATRYQKDNRP